MTARLLYRLFTATTFWGYLGLLAGGCVPFSDFSCVSSEDCPEGYLCNTARGVCSSAQVAADAALLDQGTRTDHADAGTGPVDVGGDESSGRDAGSPELPRPDGALQPDSSAAPDLGRPDRAAPDAHDAGPCPLGCPGNAVCGVASDGGAGCVCPRTRCADDYCPSALECCDPDDCPDPSFSCDSTSHTCSCSGTVCADGFCAKATACCTDTDCGAGAWRCQAHGCGCDRARCGDGFCPSEDDCCDDYDCEVTFSCSNHGCTCFGEVSGAICYPATSCPCFPAGSSSNNFCHYPPRTPGCPMTWPGGYCDQNENEQYEDADWDYGYFHYHAHCG